MFIWLIFSAVFVGAIIKACFSKESDLVRRFQFVTLDLVTIAVVMFFPFDFVRTYCDFNMNLKKRMLVVDLIQRRKLNGQGLIRALPRNLRYLSKGGGEVIVTSANPAGKELDPNTLHIFFYTFRGVLQKHSGFEYSVDDKRPGDASEARELTRLREHWYWVAY